MTPAAPGKPWKILSCLGIAAAFLILLPDPRCLAAQTEGARTGPQYSGTTEDPVRAAVSGTVQTGTGAAETETLQILSTSDIHCRYLPYDYTRDQEDTDGSMARLSTIVSSIRSQNDNTVLIDVGDAIQGSLSRTYFEAEKHPFVIAESYMRYDALVLGNHEFNFGTKELRKVIDECDTPVLCGNVYDPDGSSFAEPWVILSKNGIRIGIIGMVTPSVTVFASDSLDGCTVTDPLEETRKAVRAIRNKCDVLIAAEHMGLDEEYGVYGSGAEDIARACPEIDVILAAHAHTRVREKRVNGVLITENRKLGKTLSDVVVALRRNRDGSVTVLGKKAYSIDASGVEPDEGFLKAMKSVKILSDQENEREIGTLDGAGLSPEPYGAYADTAVFSREDSAGASRVGPATGKGLAEPETAADSRTASPDRTISFDSSIPKSGQGENTLADFIGQVQQYYTGADISATPLPSDSAGLKNGKILVRSLRDIYPDDYTIFKLRMNGRQLKEYMEWSAAYYDISSALSIRRAAGRKKTDCDIFSGIRYEIDLSRPAGSRIRNLTWPDGTPIRQDETFSIAVNRVRAEDLVENDRIFQAGEPHAQIIQGDVHDEYSGLREMIGDYIADACGGTLNCIPSGENWRIIFP